MGTKASFFSENKKRAIEIYEDEDTNIPTYYDIVYKQHGWDFAVFCRYKLWAVRKWSFLVESSVYIGGGNKKEESELMGLKKLESRSSFGFKAMPIITYDISEKWSLIAVSYGLFSLRLDTETIKNEETGNKSKPFVFWIDGDNFFYPSNLLNMGFIYHF